ncbi:MAG TPA: glycosyl hydrolase 108 family protein [Nitrospira sp.]|nr:glycosyl hydrolase 108 family protein [Nitrospira sp.]
MAEFEQAVQVVLSLEGGLSQHPADRGGVTKYGISQRSHPDLDIAALTEADAKALYRGEYWHPLFDRITDQAKASKIFDLCVNLGTTGGITLLQRAINQERGVRGHVDVDGRFGAQTLMAVNLMPVRQFLRAVRARQVRHYVNIVLEDASQLAFLDGWINRAVV